MRRVWTAVAIICTVLVTSWVTRAYLARDLPTLELWHTTDLGSEFRADDFPEGFGFAEYQALEQRLMERLATQVSDELAEKDQLLSNRYYPLSPAHPSAWSQNWNLSFEQRHPEPKGAVVLLHGASDSPYSMRTMADRFFAAGMHVIVPRLPGNGTLPGELLRVEAEDWIAVTTMAVRHAENLAGDGPVYMVGYSTGAALALHHVMGAVRDESPDVAGLFFVSPAIGITGFAALARWDVLLSRIPLFRKFAWVNIWPEHDPFKYASFPKQAGHIVYEISESNRNLVAELEGTSAWSNLPPIISFQSVVDETVDVAAVLDFHRRLGPGGHQLVLFDVNRSATIAPFLNAPTAAELLADESADNLDVTVVGNANANPDVVAAIRNCADENCPIEQPLAARWPPNVYSLSHIALPFHASDSLYGANEGVTGPRGYNLGTLNPKGERRVLVIPAEDLNRLRYNPFFDYMMRRALDFCSSCRRANP